MKRQEFLKWVLGAPLILSNALMLAAASVKEKVKFNYKRGKKGCSQCQKTMRKLESDKDITKALDCEEVTVFIKVWKSMPKVKGKTIGMGKCCSKIKNDVDIYIPGCVKEIRDKEYVKKLIYGV